MKLFKSLLVTACLAFTVAAGANDLVEGRDYKLINPPQPTDTKGKVEVTEFFWYGCSHCYEFEPHIKKWAKALPKDVAFHRVPALFPGGRWAPETKTYYALEALGLLDTLHQEVFDAIHRDRARLNDESALFAWMEKKGVERQKFVDAYNSFAVQGKMQRSLQTSQAHGLTGVPAIVVAGKYLVNGTSFENVLANTDKLVAKVRAEQGLAGEPDAKTKKGKK